MRVASLLPAATEWVAAFGAADRLVARSHECDHPPGLEEVPVVTQATYEEASGSRAINAAVQEQVQAGLSLYEVDLERLRALRPDIVLTQAQCEVCAVSRSQLEEALAGWADGEAPRLLSLSPSTLKEVLDTGLAVARAIDCLDAAMSFLAEKEKRLRMLREHLGLSRHVEEAEALPSVACIEWLDPLMTAGHWTPDLVEQAGGQAVLSEAGARSRTIPWEALRQADPEVLAILPCGFSLEETVRDLHPLSERAGWQELRAVREGRVVLFDGNAYFNRPGPRLYRSAELLAAALYPERAYDFVAPSSNEPSSNEMRRLSEVVA